MRRVVGLAALGDIFQLWLTMGIAAAMLWPIYRSEAFVILAIAAILLGTLIAVAGAAFRWPAWAVLIVDGRRLRARRRAARDPGQGDRRIPPQPRGARRAVHRGGPRLEAAAHHHPPRRRLPVAAGPRARAAAERHGHRRAPSPCGGATARLAAVAAGRSCSSWPSPSGRRPRRCPSLLGLVDARRLHRVGELVAVAPPARDHPAIRTRRAAPSEVRFGVEARTLVAALVILAVAGVGSVAATAAVPVDGTARRAAQRRRPALRPA